MSTQLLRNTIIINAGVLSRRYILNAWGGMSPPLKRPRFLVLCQRISVGNKGGGAVISRLIFHSPRSRRIDRDVKK